MRRLKTLAASFTMLVATVFCSVESAHSKKPDNPGGGGNNTGGNGGGVIYFSYEGQPYTMNDDGSSVTLLENYPATYYVNFNEEPSRDLHAGKRWFLDGDGLAILSDAGDNVPLGLPSYISHSNPRWGVGDGFLSWVGQRWDDDVTSPTYGSVVEGGLYTIDVDFDQQGNIQGTVGSPQLLASFPLVDCPAGTPCADVVAPDIQSHDWSPDGRQFVYDTLVDRELRIYDLATDSEETILSEGESWAPRWSPAGDQIMFNHYVRRGADIMVIGVDGSDMTRIQADNTKHHPKVGTWSPTGSHLIYLSDDVFNLDSHIVRATSDGKSKTLLTDERFETGFSLWPLAWREAPAAQAMAVPEPGSALLCLGLIACLAAGRRQFHRLGGLGAALLLAALLPVSAAKAAEFIPMGFPTWAGSSSVNGMSPEGFFAVGHTNVSPRGFRRSEATGFEPLGNLPTGYTFDEPQDASIHAEVVVGTLHGASDAREAFRWTPSGGMDGLGVLPGMAISWNAQVSADGAVVVGTSSNGTESARAFRWTEATGMQDLGVLQAGNLSWANGVSADGSVVAGVNFADSVGAKVDAYRWTEATGMQALPPLPGDNSSSAWGISSGGQVVVGDSVLFEGDTLVSRRAVRWTAEGVPEELGSLSADDSTVAGGASADGSVILGSSNQFGAFIWTESQGMQSLEDVFLQNGIQPTGWRRWLVGTGGISDDGLTISGWGRNADNIREGWVARLDAVPEPSTVALMVIGSVVLAVRARRRHAGQ